MLNNDDEAVCDIQTDVFDLRLTANQTRRKIAILKHLGWHRSIVLNQLNSCELYNVTNFPTEFNNSKLNQHAEIFSTCN